MSELQPIAAANEDIESGVSLAQCINLISGDAMQMV
jgi:hypothetical protein